MSAEASLCKSHTPRAVHQPLAPVRVQLKRAHIAFSENNALCNRPRPFGVGRLSQRQENPCCAASVKRSSGNFSGSVLVRFSSACGTGPHCSDNLCHPAVQSAATRLFKSRQQQDLPLCLPHASVWWAEHKCGEAMMPRRPDEENRIFALLSLGHARGTSW